MEERKEGFAPMPPDESAAESTKPNELLVLLSKVLLPDDARQKLVELNKSEERKEDFPPMPPDESAAESTKLLDNVEQELLVQLLKIFLPTEKWAELPDEKWAELVGKLVGIRGAPMRPDKSAEITKRLLQISLREDASDDDKAWFKEKLAKELLYKTLTGAAWTHEVRDRRGSRITRVQLEPSDIIAFFSGAVALIFAMGMLAGWVPIDKLTISVVTFAAVAPALAHLVKASAKRAVSRTRRRAPTS